MTKQERIAIAKDTALAWVALSHQTLFNAENCSSYAEYELMNSDLHTTMLRCEWYGKNAICELLKIDLNADVAPEVTELMESAFQYSHDARLIYHEFEDYPYKTEAKEVAE